VRPRIRHLPNLMGAGQVAFLFGCASDAIMRSTITRHFAGGACVAIYVTKGRAMQGDLTEKLLTHHIGGAWRAPFSEGMRAVVAGPGKAVIGHIVEADQADIARAVNVASTAAGGFSALPPAARQRMAARFLDAVRDRMDPIAEARALERGIEPEAAHREAQALLTAMERALMAGTAREDRFAGPVAVLGVLGVGPAPLAVLGVLLLGVIASGYCCILKPAPGAAISPLGLMDAARDALVPAGVLNLVQGGGLVTGERLVARIGTGPVLLAGKPTARAALRDKASAAGTRLICLGGPPAV